MNISEWLKSNSWALIIGIMTVVSTYTLYGYRLDELEKKVDNNAATITVMTQTNLDTQVSLAKIQTDIEYIKIQLSKLLQ